MTTPGVKRPSKEVRHTSPLFGSLAKPCLIRFGLGIPAISLTFLRKGTVYKDGQRKADTIV